MDAGTRFVPAAAAAVRAAIADVAGNEVFVLGSLAHGKVKDVRVLARGNRRAAPAILKIPRPGEVVIHNHPDGPLVPSDADLEVASALGNEGVGSYIVNNEVTEVYVVVEPLAEEEPPHIDPADATALLGPRGRIATTLRGYEHRLQQLAMTEAVARAFNDSNILTVEAGTGTGKSLAYLVPAILWAQENDERVIVSTHTINLQEQLIHKDLPFLVKRAGLQCRTALVKGRSNYLCRRKAAQLAARGAQLIEDEVARELNALLDWAKRTTDGSLADLSVRPRQEVWENIASENDNCLRTLCPQQSECFFYTARRAAAAADVLVVNHHLLMADLALRDEIGSYTHNAVLPPAVRVIIDEAHHLEDVATNYFGGHVSLAALERNLGRLRSARAENKGLLPAMLRELASIKAPGDQIVASGAGRLIEDRLLPRRSSLWYEAEEAFATILSAYHTHRGTGEQAGDKLRITPSVRASELWRLTADILTRLAASMDAYAGDLSGVIERTAQLFESGDRNILYLATELRAIQGRLAALAQALFAFTENDEEQCRWIETHRRRADAVLSFHVAPIEVAALLRRALFDRFQTAVLTSATLAVGGRFDYLHGRLGIDKVDPPERIASLRVESPFDFPSQALLLVPEELPDPGLPEYEPRSHTVIRKVLEITKGGTFVLFTAYGALNRASAALEGPLHQAGLTLLKQGETSRHLLLQRFKQEPGAVLFATDSFWEGVDVRGDALRCVVIARLPFKVPTEPIEQARVEAIQKRGGNPFLEHAVPQAVIKLKQGFGRLIRSRDDRGCVVILDSRIVHKRYGKSFFDSLPPARRVVAPSAGVYDSMRAFFAT
jgi:ATP-dependent DNA helicase DinG